MQLRVASVGARLTLALLLFGTLNCGSSIDGPDGSEPSLVPRPTGIVIFPPGALDVVRANAAASPLIGAWLDQQFSLAEDAAARAPQPLAILDTADQLDPADGAHVQAEFKIVFAFALDYAMNTNPTSLAKADEYLSAWATTYVPFGHPNVEAAFTLYVIAYELVRDALAPESKTLIDRFLYDIAETQRRFIVQDGFNGIIYGNKWSLHASIVAAIAFLRNDPEQIEYVKQLFLDQLSHNIYPAGTFEELFSQDWILRFPEFHGREYDRGVTLDFVHRDAVLYHRASIIPLYAIALMARNNGLDWQGLQGDQGQVLEWGFDFLVPYAAGEKTNYEFEDALIDWDRILGRQHWFDADDAIGDLTFAAILYPKYSVYADLKKLDSGLVPIFVTF